MTKKILVIGESCKDVFIYGSVERFAPEAPAPVFLELSSNENPGMAANVQNNIMSLSVSCDIMTNSNWETIKKTRYMDDRTNHMFVRVDTNDKSYSKFILNSETLDKILGYDVVVISDYDKGFITSDDILRISSSHQNVLLDTKKVLGDWCRNVKYIKINRDEYEKSKDAIDENISSKLIITQGKEGCVFQNKRLKVKKVSIRDVSGAGDTFMAALAVKIANEVKIEGAIKFANECATVVVKKRGVSVINDSMDKRLL